MAYGKDVDEEMRRWVAYLVQRIARCPIFTPETRFRSGHWPFVIKAIAAEFTFTDVCQIGYSWNTRIDIRLLLSI